MPLIYVGESGGVQQRIDKQHLNGTIHQSPIRRWVSESWGVQVDTAAHRTAKGKKYPRKSTSKEQEREVSLYMQEGSWKAIPCESETEAQEFECYCVENLKPEVPDKRCKPSRKDSPARYNSLLDQLPDAAGKDRVAGPGVYFFYHDDTPKGWRDGRRSSDPKSEPSLGTDEGEAAVWRVSCYWEPCCWQGL